MVRQLAFRVLLVVAAALVAPSVTAAQTTHLTTIRFIAAPSDDLLPFWYAQSKGLFRAAGLDIEATVVSSGAVVAQAIVGGTYDLGRSSVGALIAAHIQGIPFVLVAPGALHRKNDALANSAILVAAGSPIKSVLDLQGKTVSCSAIGDIGYLGIRGLIDAQGGDSSTVRWVEIPASAAAAALAQGRVDASSSNEPYMTRDLASGTVRSIGDPLNGYSGEILEGAYFAMGPYANANRDALARFAKVLRQAAIYADSHREELLPLLIANTKLDPDVAARMHRATSALSFEPSQVQPVIDLEAKYKTIPHGFDAREMFLTTTSR